MRYLIVHATGEDFHYVSTTDYKQALKTYRDWLGAYADASGDEYARNHLDWLGRVGLASQGWMVEYQSDRYGNMCTPKQVFVLSALIWPRVWSVPPESTPQEWGRCVKHVDHPDGHFELRTDGRTWRTFWFAKQNAAAFAATRRRDVAAEAVVEFAFIEALAEHARTGDDDLPSPDRP